MTRAERAAVHAMAGAFQRLALASELAVMAHGERRERALAELERLRAGAIREFSAALAEIQGGARHDESGEKNLGAR